MRVSKAEKAKSRERIVEAASRLFREAGAAGASVADVMRAAGLTHGGFYRHFADKDALLAAALTGAFEELTRPLQQGTPEARARFRARYLSEAHRASAASGCPVAALGPDAARAGASVRDAFSRGIEAVVAGLGDPDARREAMRDFAMMVGAIVVARAVRDGLARELLAACRDEPATPARAARTKDGP